MKLKILTSMCFAVVLFFMSTTAPGYDFTAGNIDGNIKGEVLYSVKTRVEDELQDYGAKSMWNIVFEKGHLTNNRLMTKVALEAYSGMFLFSAEGQAYYDTVWTDDTLYDFYRESGNTLTEGQEDEIKAHAAYQIDAPTYFVQGDIGKVTFRVGKQVVVWGESAMSVAALGVNCVNPFSLSKVADAGYSTRDLQLPMLMGWITYEATETLAIDAVYSPSYTPKEIQPRIGNQISPIDVMGYGTGDSFVYREIPLSIIDNNPEDFKDKQEYGGSIKKTFTNLNYLELGLYYYHHYSRAVAPIIDLDLSNRSLNINYEVVDMYGLSVAYAIDPLGIALGAELAYRPNNKLAKDYIVPESFLVILDALGVERIEKIQGLGGSEDARTICWDINFMKVADDVLPFTPWNFGIMAFLEFYGQYNLDYEDEKNFTYPVNTPMYFLTLPFTTSDIIDNTSFTFGFSFSGSLYDPRDSHHSIDFNIDAKYGNRLKMGIAFNGLRYYDLEQVTSVDMPDRRTVSFKVAYTF